MMRVFKSSRLRVCAGVLTLAAWLTGCGGAGTHTAEAMQQVKELQYKEALAEFQTASDAGENERLIRRGQGIAYMGMADYENAIASFEAALQESNGFVQSVDYDLNYYLAAAYAKSGQLAEAEQIYDAILAMKSDEEAYFLRGNIRLERNHFEGAKEDFDKVISMDGSNYSRLIEIYQALDKCGYKEVGRQYLHDCLEQNSSRMSNFDSGRMYYYLGEFSQACMILEKAKEKGNADSYLYLGKAYEATGDYNYASSVYNSWLAKDAGSAEIYNQLGLCEMHKGNYQAALDAFQSGMKIEQNPVMQALSFNEIVAYEYLGDYAKALALVENYLKNYPDDETAGRERDFLKTR
ncbi:MAG: tetratricopeptide repeat protein [Lachnospiraceae bacterium]|nr:tetratricopeptide repeat protein [Lachnospiraceae bacterium]